MSTDTSMANRDFLDPVFKEVMTFNFGQLALPVETQVEVSRLPRTMDALIVLEQVSEREKVHEQTAFNYFQVHNQIEFKGKTDPLTRDEYKPYSWTQLPLSWRKANFSRFYDDYNHFCAATAEGPTPLPT